MSTVIIGGGVCGLSIGWRLARAGQPAIVCDRGPAGRQSSWAAAGMLCPHTEGGTPALAALMRDSLACWPRFVAELEAESGIDVGYREEGVLMVAHDREGEDALDFHSDWLASLGFDSCVRLSRHQVRTREPRLHPGICAGLFSPHDRQLDNRKLVEALIVAFGKAGGVLCEHTHVQSLIWRNGRVHGVEVDDGETLEAGRVVLAAGAWSPKIEGVALSLPIRPVKGQMLALAMNPQAPLIEHTLWGRDVYLVPRRDGRLLVGATVEEAGFDRTVTAGAVYGLLKHAGEMLPDIAELPLLETWAGLRPASYDNAPVLGPLIPDSTGDTATLIVATGHHRNGILLAPATADCIAAYCFDGRMTPVLEAFAPQRFGRAGRAHAPSQPASGQQG